MDIGQSENGIKLNYQDEIDISAETDEFLPSKKKVRRNMTIAATSITSRKFRINYPTKNIYLNVFLFLIILFCILIFMYLIKDHSKQLLIWIENQNPWYILSAFIFLFIFVSFPFCIGYLMLMLASGYLFGIIKGLFIILLGANLGIFVAHTVIKNFHRKYSIQWLVKNDFGKTILSVISVISGPKAFKIVTLTRLTPIPFGIQNTIFGISSVPLRIYYVASFLGLLPAQIINVYLGSNFRSIHDVMNQGTSTSAYGVFIIQVLIAVALMIWVIQKAKNELSEALLVNEKPSNLSDEFNIEV